MVVAAAEFLALDALVSLLFYRSWIPFALFLGIFPFFLKQKRTACRKQQILQMQREFLDGMQFTLTALQAGYAMENAFAEALSELRKLYEPDAFIVKEFRYLAAQLQMNVPAETLIMSLAVRSGVEDIRNFADVFVTARKTGGDMIAIIRNTISGMRQKEETREEIETVLAGKRLEQRIMSVIPLFILFYVSLTSPGLLSGMYSTGIGIAVMTGCLLVYGGAFLWGRKIMDIQI